MVGKGYQAKDSCSVHSKPHPASAQDLYQQPPLGLDPHFKPFLSGGAVLPPPVTTLETAPWTDLSPPVDITNAFSDEDSKAHGAPGDGWRSCQLSLLCCALRWVGLRQNMPWPH